MKGCEQHFAPLAGDQRFCGTAACRAELRRWADGLVVVGVAKAVGEAGGYGVRRCARPGCPDEFSARSPTHLFCHACGLFVAKDRARERQTALRRRAKALEQTAQTEGLPPARSRPSEPVPEPSHAPGDLCQSVGRCQRPGCYEPRQECLRRRAAYCGPECARAARRVLDRERKWRLALARRERRRSAVIELPLRPT